MTVRVTIHSGLPPARVWPALHEVDRLGQWFGELDHAWRPGQPARLDFGDGDFFTIDTHDVVAPEWIAFDWRFLGLGPTARIRWQVRPVPGGSDVSVVDTSPDRSPAEADELRAGWTDFFERLSRHLATGARTRYDTRDDIDGTVALGGAAARLFGPDTVHRWLPIATDGFAPRWFFVVDGDGPRRFRLDGWQAGPDGVSFTVDVPGATEARAWAQPVGSGWHLSFRHTGWGQLGLPDRQARLLRSRFTAAWVAALRTARELTGTS
ncbi:MAG TPA: SRPBCC domain-containing protein [Rugosimonospora sp.]|nr:SRPBCC domain-containing protein [Rugosimonospora sp.]